MTHARPRRRSSDRRMFFLFLDGVGIGTDDDGVNPFFAHSLPNLTGLLGGGMLSLADPVRNNGLCSACPLDATLGVPGLPQSGTGQTAMLTGMNAAQAIGKHFGPYPYTTLRDSLTAENLFRKLALSGVDLSYLNAYPRQYFDHIGRHPMRASAISVAWRTSGFGLSGHEELKAGTALSADFTAAAWPKLGYPDVGPITPREAAGRVAGLLESREFLFMEYFLTDHAGHGGSMEEAGRVLADIDEFVGEFVRLMDPERHSFLLTSDHGNLEDLSTRKHTLNPVPLICAGADHGRLTSGPRDLTDVAGAVLEYFT